MRKKKLLCDGLLLTLIDSLNSCRVTCKELRTSYYYVQKEKKEKHEKTSSYLSTPRSSDSRARFDQLGSQPSSFSRTISPHYTCTSLLKIHAAPAYNEAA